MKSLLVPAGIGKLRAKRYPGITGESGVIVMKAVLLGAALAAATLAGGSSAFAFQFVNPDTNLDGSSKFTTTPDQQPLPAPNSRFNLSSGGSAGASTLKFGDTTLQFGMSGRNSGNSGLSPALQEKFLQSPASRTVPSQQGW